MVTASIEKCQSYILSQAEKKNPGANIKPRSTLTISRETGAGAVTIGHMVADLLQRGGKKGVVPWPVFDQEIVKLLLEQRRLPPAVERFVIEDRKPLLEDALEELLGLHPLVSDLAGETAKLILRLARTGGVILIGRGGHVIAARLPHAFHVRLVAPLRFRIAHVSEYRHLTKHEASAYVERWDRARRRYIRRHFHMDAADPHNFHLVLDTGRLGFAESARLIADMMRPAASEGSLR
jgi:hypothetical protein